jgi:hypothetical protein
VWHDLPNPYYQTMHVRQGAEMRASTIGRILGRALAAAVLGLGVVGVGAAAHASDFDWGVTTPVAPATGGGLGRVTADVVQAVEDFDWA